MALPFAASSSSTPTILCTQSVPKTSFMSSESMVGVSNQRNVVGLGRPKRRLGKLNAAGLSEIEPDINEDPVDRWATNSISPVPRFSYILLLCHTVTDTHAEIALGVL